MSLLVGDLGWTLVVDPTTIPAVDSLTGQAGWRLNAVISSSAGFRNGICRTNGPWFQPSWQKYWKGFPSSLPGLSGLISHVDCSLSALCIYNVHLHLHFGNVERDAARQSISDEAYMSRTRSKSSTEPFDPCLRLGI